MIARERPLSGLLALIGFAMVGLGAAGAAADPQCTCRYAGQSYDLGSCVCIHRPGGGQQFACCGMVLNNTSWKFSGEGCPVAMSRPADASRTPAPPGDGSDVVPEVAFSQQ